MNGKYLYETYSSGQSIQWKNWKGEQLPQWEELQKDRQDGWNDLAREIPSPRRPPQVPFVKHKYKKISQVRELTKEYMDSITKPITKT